MGDEVTSKVSNAGSTVPCFSIQIGFVRETFSIPDEAGESRSIIIKEKVYDMVRKRVSMFAAFHRWLGGCWRYSLGSIHLCARSDQKKYKM